MSVDIRQGDARAVLAGLPPASVHCVITSPPYFGLRSYRTAGQVWGGDPGCRHEWVEASRSMEQGNKRRPVDHEHDRDRSQDKAVPQTVALATAQCSSCDAWRGELGAEDTPAAYVAHLVEVFRAVHRVLRDDGLLWLVLGDSYANDTKWGGNGSGPTTKNWTSGRGGYAGQKAKRRTGFKPKDLMMIPHRVALALQADGWYVRNDCVWAKGSAMPESVQDRFSRAHEYVFHLAKSERYYFDPVAVAEPATMTPQRRSTIVGMGRKGVPGRADNNGSRRLRDQPEQEYSTRNRRSVLHINPQPFSAADFGVKDIDHYAVFPEKMVEILTLCSTSEAGCCPRCAAPWRRVVERTPMVIARSGRREAMGEQGRTQSSGTMVRPASSVTKGWEAGCSCDAGLPLPCTVLDPFAGSGTTLLVARRLGRSAIGVDLNAAYCALARKRVDSSPEALFSAAAYQSSTEGAAR